MFKKHLTFCKSGFYYTMTDITEVVSTRIIIRNTLHRRRFLRVTPVTWLLTLWQQHSVLQCLPQPLPSILKTLTSQDPIDPSKSQTNRSVKVTDHFTCISSNVIYCITCTLCKKIYIGETGRRLADRFREHLRDAEQNNTDASKPVARHFNLPNHSHHNMTICGLYLHHGNTESRKNLEQKLIFQLGTLSPHGINERLSFH